MKKILLIFLSTLVISCGKEVNCSGKDKQKILFDLLSSNFESTYLELKEKNDLEVVFDLPYEDVKNDFFSEVIKLEGMRPSKVDKELKKCDCDAKITAQLPAEITDYLEKNLTENYTFDLELIKKSESIDDLKYSLQLTEDNQIYCETLNKNILLQFFIDYTYYKNIINNHKNGLLKNNKENSVENEPKKEINEIDATLINQLKNPEIVKNSSVCENNKYCNVAYEWSKLYYSLPLTFQKNVQIKFDIFPVAINDFHGLWKGFHYISKNENMNKISEIITEKIEYKNEPVAFRASMVYFYVKYQLLKEED